MKVGPVEVSFDAESDFYGPGVEFMLQIVVYVGNTEKYKILDFWIIFFPAPPSILWMPGTPPCSLDPSRTLKTHQTPKNRFFPLGGGVLLATPY